MMFLRFREIKNVKMHVRKDAVAVEKPWHNVPIALKQVCHEQV